ncbi:hypothetical protein E2C01_027077 [Portunus trituberculatus]|uniref:Uncharacterized protein n=1 Tax=Portunus trituberculatus TaxID=210409 RepID=A0A5B7EK71_PORTR|nr:hypothetical protein [Portunus trituberculatus]
MSPRLLHLLPPYLTFPCVPPRGLCHLSFRSQVEINLLQFLLSAKEVRNPDLKPMVDGPASLLSK